MSVERLSAEDKLVRKLRKKLRQIEHLETSGRSLNEEESIKVKSKGSIRAELAQLLNSTGNQAYLPTPEIIEEVPLTCPENVEGSQVNSEIPFFQKEEQTVTLVHDEAINMKRASTPTELSNSPNDQVKKKNNAKRSPEKTSLIIKTTEPSLPSNPCKDNNMQPSTAPSSTPGPSQSVVQDTHTLPSFIFTNLETDGGLTCCVDVNESLVISGSRDTVVQVWDGKTGDIIQCLRGHTNGVSGAILLSASESEKLAQTLNLTDSPKMAITSSLDCYLKLWNIESGTAISSIYTFSSITAVCYSPAFSCCIVGSEGGKVEVYSFSPDCNGPIHSVKAFDEAVSSIRLKGNHIICSSLDGYLSVWTLAEVSGLQLSRKYVSENLKDRSGHPVSFRPIRCLALGPNVSDGPVYYGDEGANLKVVHWKRGEVTKLKNHVHEVGITNAMCATNRLLFSSSVDLDTGNTAINIRSLPDEKYLYTLNFGQIGQIACLAVWESEDGQLRLAVGGSKLFVLELKTGSRNAKTKRKILKPVVVRELSQNAENSEDESSTSSSDSEEEMEPVVMESSNVVSSGSWCLIL